MPNELMLADETIAGLQVEKGSGRDFVCGRLTSQHIICNAPSQTLVTRMPKQQELS